MSRVAAYIRVYEDVCSVKSKYLSYIAVKQKVITFTFIALAEHCYCFIIV